MDDDATTTTAMVMLWIVTTTINTDKDPSRAFKGAPVAVGRRSGSLTRVYGAEDE